MNEKRGTVYIVDDDPSVRSSLGRLAKEVDLPCMTFGSADEFMTCVDSNSTGCVVLDIRMPGMSGIELHKRMLAEGISMPVIIVSGHGDIPMATAAMRRGAVDFLEKPVNPQLLLDRIQQALDQDLHDRVDRAERERIAVCVDSLTPREREVVDLAITGMSNKQIAIQFGVSSQAIDAHRARALKKMEVDTVPELVQVMLKYRDGVSPAPVAVPVEA